MFASVFFVNFVLAQGVAIFIVSVVLKKILDANLIDLAIRQWEVNVSGSKPPAAMDVVSHKRISAKLKERILSKVKKKYGEAVTPDFKTDPAILGGLIIRHGDRTIDFSLRDRLQKASGK